MDQVVIVGAGLGGLLLAILLEQASVPYVLLERAPVSNMPLEGGGVITLTSQIQPLLKQLGVLEALEKVSKPVSRVEVFEAKQGKGLPRLAGIFENSFVFTRYGYHNRVISRPELYNILVDLVPQSKLLLGKQVDSVRQQGSITTVDCIDGSSYSGIIVGADGAYSNVRLNMYRQLRDQNLLPALDRKPLQYRYQALVGMTKPLDPVKFAMSSDHSKVRVVVSEGKTPFTFWCVPMTMNRICWMLDRPLGETHACPDVEDLSYHPELVAEMTGVFQSHASPIKGVTIHDIFEATPEGTMLALPREEAFFTTWSSGKVVLMGDATHKVIPYGGQSMVQAGYDAVALANILYRQSLDPSRDIIPELALYAVHRRAAVKNAVEYSHLWAELLFWQGWLGRVARSLIFNYCPRFLLYAMGDRLNRDRPQAEFLPKVE
ncbi:hypothetical protein BGZ83_010141 [Gryganskiella cystojenkinii]|nr:hypothetical protein BGZ83_010141 [Gryganskiella cystojenkinii]